MISPEAYFWSKGLFENFSLGGGGALIRGGLDMDEYLRFQNAIFCSSNCNFLTFSVRNHSLLLDFSLFYL